MNARATAPAQPEKWPLWPHDQFVNKQADDDGGCRQQNIVDEANNLGKRASLAVLGEMRAGKDADRTTQQHRDSDHYGAAVDSVKQAAIGAGRRRHLRHQFQVERAEAVDQRCRQNPYQPDQPKSCGGRREAERRDIGDFAPATRAAAWSVALLAAQAQQHDLGCRQDDECDDEKHESRARSTTRDRCRRSASVNSLAIAAAIELPGSSNDALT